MASTCSTAVGSTSGPSGGGSMSRPKILMVEDSEDNLRILAYRLRKLGDFDLREARDGREAVAAVEADPPDLIFSLRSTRAVSATMRTSLPPGSSRMRRVASQPSIRGRRYSPRSHVIGSTWRP